MVALFRFGFRRSVPWSADHLLEDARWSLAAVDPRSAKLRCGRFEASDGADIPYRLWLAKKPRAAILMLHGACDYSGSFDEVAPALARRGFTALAIDQRGFGGTATRGVWSGHDRMAQDAAEAVAFLRRRLGQELPLFILGESMGGALAVLAAARFDINAEGLILVSPGAIASLLWNVIFVALIWLLKWMPRTRELVFDRISGWDLSPGAAIRLMGDPLVLRAIRPEILSGLLDLSWCAVEEARRVQIATLTLVAAKDDVLREACIRQLHDNLSGEKTWEVIENGPHLLLQWQRGHEVLWRARRWMYARLHACAAPGSDLARVETRQAIEADAARSSKTANRSFQSASGAT